MNICYNYRMDHRGSVIRNFRVQFCPYPDISLLKELFCGMKKKLIELKNICKAFDGEQILSHVDLYINDHEFITLL